VALAEYNVHWAGWPDEDDNWSIGPGNIPKEFIEEFNQISDPFRCDPTDKPLLKQDLVFLGDLPKAKELDRKRKRSSANSVTHTRGRAIPCVRKTFDEDSTDEEFTGTRNPKNKHRIMSSNSNKTMADRKLENNEANAMRDSSETPRRQNELGEPQGDIGMAATKNKRVRSARTGFSRERDLGFIGLDQGGDGSEFESGSKNQ
jgi:hypothetical protein